MAGVLTENGWRDGYLIIAAVQFGLALVLLLSFPLWKQKGQSITHHQETAVTTLERKWPLGISYALVTFLLYCGVEALIGLWTSSYLVQTKQFSIATAAAWVSIYYGSITLGRFVSGFLSFRFTNKQMIRMGQSLALLGSIFFFIPTSATMLVGLILIGFGLAPIYPSMLHDTPNRFGSAQSKRLMGFQMAFAYTGSTFLPPLFGLLVSQTSLGFLPLVTIMIMMGMLFSTERLNRIIKLNKA
jgi:fucose permease